MILENFINRLFIESINVMQTEKWQWPDKWDTEKQIKFLDDSLRYAETNEYYEQCAIIRDVKNKIQTNK